MAVVLHEEPAVVIEAEQAGKAAEAIENARRMGALDERHHAGQALLVQFEIEAGFAIGQLGLALFIHSLALYAEKGAPGSLAPVFRTCAD